jgi:DNA-binding NarL/FixJ family response regulator
MVTKSETVSVLIVDDHAVVRAGLRSVLDGHERIEVVAEAGDAEGALGRAQALRPDIVLLDVRLDGNDDARGIEVCRQIRDELPETRVVMFTSFGEREAVLASVLAGASGFLTKNLSHAKLIDALLAVGHGESILDPAVTRDVLERLSSLSSGGDQARDPLSAREREVLALVARGYTNKEIAEELTVSPYTARNHVIHILDKLGVSRRSEAAAEAVRRGLLDEA